jgi:hypothetical protein
MIRLTFLPPATPLNVLQARLARLEVTHNDTVPHAHSDGLLVAAARFAAGAEGVTGFVMGEDGGGEEEGEG